MSRKYSTAKHESRLSDSILLNIDNTLLKYPDLKRELTTYQLSVMMQCMHTYLKDTLNSIYQKNQEIL